MKISHYWKSLRLVTRRHEIAVQHSAPVSGNESQKHCLILHGWASDARAMRAVREYLRETQYSRDWNFWDISYDTTWQDFPTSARQILEKLQSTSHTFGQTILIGYSMGGLITRQLVAEGMTCSHLITLCTPHHGPVRWMPVPTRGPRSLANWSRHANTLANHPRDLAHRERFHFYAITYSDTFGFHRHDGMVTQASALGEKLSGIGSRKIIRLKYRIPISAVMPIDPHWRGMFPKYIGPALQHVESMMSQSGTPQNTLVS